jgi:osmotically-inducible protein OsmY
MKRLFRNLLSVVAVIMLFQLGCSQGTTDTGQDRTFHQVMSDAATTASVKLSLAFQRGVHASEINVDTDRGVVTLNGEVASQAERQLAVKVAEDVSGVKEVVNRIHVRG